MYICISVYVYMCIEIFIRSIFYFLFLFIWLKFWLLIGYFLWGLRYGVLWGWGNCRKFLVIFFYWFSNNRIYRKWIIVIRTTIIQHSILASITLPTVLQTTNLAVDSESIDKAFTMAITWEQLNLPQIITGQSVGMMGNIRTGTSYQIIFDKVDSIIEIYLIQII